MRAFAMGAINNKRTKILLDIGDNISVIGESFAQKLKLKSHMSTDKQINVQGVGRSMVATTSQTTAKVTLKWEVVYGFEV